MKEYIDFVLKKEKKPVDIEKLYRKIEKLKMLVDPNYFLTTEDMEEIDNILTKGIEKYEYYKTPNGNFTLIYKTSYRKGRFHGNKIGEGFVISNTTYTTKVTDDTIINSDVTFVAKWKGLNVVARVGDEEFTSLQDAINSLPDDGTKTVVTVLQDLTITSTTTINATKNVELDLQDNTLESTNVATLTNYGTLTIKNGTLINNGAEPKYSIDNKSTGVVYITGGTIRATKSNAIANVGRIEITGGYITGIADAAAINNNTNGILIISGGSIVTTNSNKGQAVYNNGGTITVRDNAYLENNSSNRGALHNNLGTINILGGTIISNNFSAVVNNDIMTIGDDSDPINITTPVLQGKTYGLEINSGKTVTVYDGIFKGIAGAINDTSRVTHNSNVDFNTTNTETIGSDTYHIAYLEEQ